ncbi:MAG: hypothetical protein ACRC9R_11225, partial [Enterovibrio sp.]
MITRNALQNINLLRQLDNVKQNPASRLSAKISRITISKDPRNAADSSAGRQEAQRFCGKVLKAAEKEMFAGPLSDTLEQILNKASIDRG